MAATDTDQCGIGFEQARSLEQISALVLEHDLQRAIHRELSAAGPDQ
jgi:hypothetical protein